MPKVSVCIPTYNNLTAFQRCFESVLIQTYKDYEVIITDDSTNDDIKNYLNNLQLTENIHYYKNQKSLGSPENWNEAMRKASGEYIKIIHHDDFFTYENSLQIFVDLLDHNPESDFGFVASKNFNLSTNNVINFNRPAREKIEEIRKNPIVLLKGNYIGAPSAVIFRRNSNLSFDKELIWFVDLDFYINIILSNNKIVYASQDLITVGIAHGRITAAVEDDKNIVLKEFFYLLNRYNIKYLKDSQFKNEALSLLKRFNVLNKKDLFDVYEKQLPYDIDDLFLEIQEDNLKISKTKKSFLTTRIFFKILRRLK